MKQSIRLLVTTGLLCIVTKAKAQFTDYVDSTQTQVFGDTSMHGVYMIPDVPRKWLKWSEFSGKYFSMRLGFAPIIDYSFFSQNDENIAQVGEQEAKFELRSGRFSARGELRFFKPAWTYFISLEYKGFDREPEEKDFGMTDLYLIIPVGKVLGKLQVGKIKETFVYEMVGDAANLPYTERILSPFFVSRNIGFKLQNTALPDDRLNWAVGYFNQGITDGDKASNHVSARVTFLPIYVEHQQFLHLGISGRYVDGIDDKLRYRGRPESNVTDYFVDTKDFAGEDAFSMGLEQLWSINNFSLLGEYVSSWADSPELGTQQFNGITFTGSWVISGEQRPYDKKAAYARRVMPKGKHGAWEVVLRGSRVDLTTREIEGGIMRKLYLGLNWWATQHWRVTFGYGLTGLDKDGLDGTMHSGIVRLQWIY